MSDKSENSDKFEAYLTEHPFIGRPQNLYDAMNYIMQLGGKRIRPQLCLLAYESVKGEQDADALKLALAVETFHNFSLLHDDIMDNALVRRGKTSVHEKWNKATAILAGDNLLIKSYSLILETGFTNKELLLEIFTQMAIQVCEGQQMDMDLPEQTTVNEEVYLDMIRLKTAVLPASALKIGALAAGSEPNIADHFYKFGLHLGMAFQLQDDYLDCFGFPSETGKQIGGDIIENKKTLLYLHAIQNLDKSEREELSAWYNNKVHDLEMKVEQVNALFKKAGSDLYILNLKTKYEQQALYYLEKSCTENLSRLNFMQLFGFLKTRKV